VDGRLCVLTRQAWNQLLVLGLFLLLGLCTPYTG